MNLQRISTYRNVSFSSDSKVSDWISLMLFSARDLSGTNDNVLQFILLVNDSKVGKCN